MKLRQYEGRLSNRSIFHKTPVISRFISIFSYFGVTENLLPRFYSEKDDPSVS